MVLIHINSIVEQELLALPEHLSLPPFKKKCILIGVCVVCFVKLHKFSFLVVMFVSFDRNMTGVTSGAGTVNTSGTPEPTHSFFC